jgi:hypothetical protein
VHPSATYKPCESNLTKHFHIMRVSPCFQEVFVFSPGNALFPEQAHVSQFIIRVFHVRGVGSHYHGMGTPKTY